MTNAYPTLTFHWMDIEVLIRPKYAVYVFPEATTPERKNISRESEAFGWSGFYKLATVQDSDHQSPPGWAGRARQKRRRVDDHPSVQKPGFDPYNGVRHWDNFHPSWIVCHLALVTATPHLEEPRVDNTMPAGQIMQALLSLPARSRAQMGTLRNRVFSSDKPKKETQLLRRSFNVHRPVWATAGGAAYTTMAAVYITLRCMRHLR